MIPPDQYALFDPGIDRALLAAVIAMCGEAKPANGHMPLEVRMSNAALEIGSIIAARFEWPRIRMHIPPMVRRVDPGDTTAVVPRHQDLAYNRHIAGPFITAWLPLVDIDDLCGGIAVYRGSTGRGELPRYLVDSPDWLGAVCLRSLVGCERVVLKPLAGTAVLMAHDLVHESMPNISDHPRYSIDYRFFDAGVVSSKPSLLL